jgi:hypothetical protein
MACQHEGCRCNEARVEREGRKFCSETCADSAHDRKGAPCPCGHPDCAAV